MNNGVKSAAAVFMAAVTYLFGGFDGLFTALVAVICLDYGTGVLCALYEKRLDSRAGAKGIVKKIMCLAIVALATIIDRVLGSGQLLRDVCIYFFIANEGLSIVENSAKMGFPVPTEIVARLQQLKDYSKQSKP